MNQNSDSDCPLNEGNTSNVHKIDSTSNVHKIDSDIQISKPARSVTAVKYGVSPAKVAEIERLSSTESEASSDDSEENKTSADRSRAHIRSASSRRSASPMRRIQIGRTGSRRPNSLTVKSLSYYPGREMSTSHRDVAANTIGDEGSEQPSQKPENNARSLTVQDAINLFESKQKNQTADVGTRLSLTNISLSANKSVLRRRSEGLEKSSSQWEIEVASEGSDTMIPNDVDGMNSKSLVEVKQEPDLVSGLQNPVDTVAMSADMQRGEKVTLDSVNIQQEAMATEKVETNGGSTASLEWSRQKEAELNQMLKMMEQQPVINTKHQPSRNQNLPSELRGGFYNHYNKKRDAKLRGENAKKRTEKEAQFRAMQLILDERKAEMASANINDVSKKLPFRKPQNSLKSLHHNENSKKETSKSSAMKKVSSKPSPLPASRKSWPLTASPRSITSPAKAPAGISSGGITPTQRRKSQPTLSLPRTSSKVEKSQLRPRNPKESLPVNNQSLKSVNEKRQQPVKKGGRAAKAKVEVASRDCSGIVPAKPSLYNKVTKKNSIVPLESKTILRKGSGTGSRVGPLVKKKNHSSSLEDSSKNCTTLTKSQENKVVVKMCEDHHDAPAEAETLASSTQSCGEMEKCNNEAAAVHDDFQNMAEPSLEILAEDELTISPTAWVEIEEQEYLPHPYDDCKSLLLSPANGAAIGLPSTHARLSLSQMLQKESSELDNIEWGNAETHTAFISAKDAPKGLKRLLKFARKSKEDSTITGWSSSSFFSEGEENAEESGASSKRNTDNLLRKATLNVKTDWLQRSLPSGGNEKYMNACELPSAQQNISRFEVQSSHRLHKGNVPTSTSVTKGTKSFFSLTAFRGGKPTETKLH